MTDPIRVGVIGTGAMGTSHARMLARWVPGAQVVSVHDFDAGSAQRVAAELGAEAAGTAAELIEAVDAVVVAAPDPTHEELTLACIAADRPVLCEKPLALDAEGAARVVAAEAGHGRALVQVGFMRRYDPAFVALRQGVLGGQVGRPLVVHCVHRNAAAHPSATSDGIVSNSMIHELDCVPWLLDDAIAAITVTSPRVEGIRDPQVALLETVRGALITVEVFVNAGYGYDVRCEVVGAAGTLRLTPPYGLAARAHGGDQLQVSADFVARFADAYRIELASWVDGLRRGEVDGPTAHDGYRAAVVAACGVESLHTGARVQVPQP